MQIVCTSTSAAAQVLLIPLAARLRPVQDFELRSLISTLPPISVTLLQVLPAAILDQIGALADTTIT